MKDSARITCGARGVVRKRINSVFLFEDKKEDYLEIRIIPSTMMKMIEEGFSRTA